MMQVLNSFIFYSLIFACFISYSPAFVYFFYFCMCASMYVYIYLAVPLLPWFSWDLSIKKTINFALRMYARMCVYMYTYESVCASLYKCIFIFRYVSGFLRWYLFLLVQTSGWGTQVYSYDSDIYIYKITTVMTISVYLTFINGFKIIWKHLPQKYNKENTFCYWLYNRGVFDLTFNF